MEMDDNVIDDELVVGKPTIGYKMRRVREIRGYKQGALAKTIGVSQQTISDWEKLDSIPKSTLQKYSDALGIDPEEIVNFEEKAVLQFFNCTQTVTNGNGTVGTSSNNVVHSFSPEALKLLDKFIKEMMNKAK